MNEKGLPRAPQRTTPGFSFSMINRALTECLGKRQFGVKEQEAAARFFGNGEPECAFCGSTDIRRWDHLVAVMEDGETVPGNMVPACARCDDSKRHLPFDEWMRGDAPQSPTTRGIPDVERRIERIEAFRRENDYAVRLLESRLTREEWETLESIRSRLDTLRREVDKLITDFRERTGYR